MGSDLPAQDEAADAERAIPDARYLAAIVESSDDAILTKNLDGVITSWNRGAQRLFGYTAQEVIGKSVTILIPPDRSDEEPAILARIRRGERIVHYDTLRQRKDGTSVHISLTVSPVKDAQGRVIGASKIAHDISDRKQAEEKQELLLREMDHRVRNLFTLAGSVVALSARSAPNPQDLVADICERLAALARAHSLTLRRPGETVRERGELTPLHALIEAIVLPHSGRTDDGGPRIVVGGADIPLFEGMTTSFALLLNEFATNAAKYGALSTLSGTVEIDCFEEDGDFVVTWTERGGPRIEEINPDSFGSLLGKATVERQLGGTIIRDWRPDGLVIRLAVPRGRLTPGPLAG